MMLLAVLAACSQGPAPVVDDPPVVATGDTDEISEAEATAARFYDPDHVVEIALEMDEADAEALAAQTNDLFALLEGEECMDSPWNGPFTWFHADVTIDGERFEDVGVRKKGLIGSLSSDKPSLKIDLDQFWPDQAMGGLQHVVLNNSISDPGLVRQCLGYDLFREAGMPAPRCNFAHVTANGDDLGVYVNVEPPKKDFLRHAFGDDEGDLYEGTLSDFREGWTATFEPDTDATDEGLGPILALTAVLEDASDATLLAELEPVLDLDAFARFWVLETLIGHLDGYNGNTNNFYVYRPSESEQLQFVPWGIDATFLEFEAFGATSGALVLATSQLSRRLWDLPAGRDLYLEALDEVLATAWDEHHLLGEIERMVALVEPYALPDEGRPDSQDLLRAYVAGRRAQLEAALAQPLPVFEEPLREPLCMVYGGTMRVEFDTTWGTLEVYDPLSVGTSSIDGALDGVPFALDGSAVAGESYGTAVIAGLAWSSPTEITEAVLYLPMDDLTPGTTPLVHFQDFGLLVGIDLVTEAETSLGSLWNATLTLDEVDTAPGGRVRGSFEGDLYTGGLF